MTKESFMTLTEVVNAYLDQASNWAEAEELEQIEKAREELYLVAITKSI